MLVVVVMAVPALFVVPADGGRKPRSITDAFDEQPSLLAWKADGVYFGASQKTAAHLFRVDPATGVITRVSQPDALMLAGGSLSSGGGGRSRAGSGGG